jgi:hypothetical protein
MLGVSINFTIAAEFFKKAVDLERSDRLGSQIISQCGDSVRFGRNLTVIHHSCFTTVENTFDRVDSQILSQERTTDSDQGYP